MTLDFDKASRSHLLKSRGHQHVRLPEPTGADPIIADDRKRQVEVQRGRERSAAIRLGKLPSIERKALNREYKSLRLAGQTEQRFQEWLADKLEIV